MGQLTSRFRSLFESTKNQEIIMVGLDAVGKTTILYILKDNQELPTVPTIGFNIEECQIKKTKLKIWDVGGQERIRHLWATYSKEATGVVYVFDISYPGKWREAADHLMKVMDERRLPTLILMNKTDLLSGPAEIESNKKKILDMCDFTSFSKGMYEVFTVSAKKDESDPDRAYSELERAFTWLDNAIQKRGG
ncbi:UNVERIFIED_CONTAM: hypothetical protein PYX00_011285 [Menopon gallinae]|uniref:Uncharacterized protein n=1 Tax=Menopon gallinae TaxID=328185 RepID=A0AAW2H767_9NEOP